MTKNIFYWFAVANKDDDPERKVVLTHDAQRFAEQMGIQLYETSAKENINVEEVSNLTHSVNFLDMIIFSIGKKIEHHSYPFFVSLLSANEVAER